ncbi:MAG TPA: hypothetical protein VHW00_14675 [Thermoanaerobaculia bacterium]|nr:hypothetical protein [Thermoanaerobaculia bacterium]
MRYAAAMERMPETFVQLGRLRVGRDGAGEMDGPRPLVFIPRAEIAGIESARMVGGERPLLLLVIGLVLLIVAIVPVVALAQVLRHGGTFHAEWIAAIACVIPAAWLLELSLRKRAVLLVTMKRGRRKLLFPRGTSDVEAGMFVARARGEFGYD